MIQLRLNFWAETGGRIVSWRHQGVRRQVCTPATCPELPLILDLFLNSVQAGQRSRGKDEMIVEGVQKS
jgi:hypothetical protein